MNNIQKITESIAILSFHKESMVKQFLATLPAKLKAKYTDRLENISEMISDIQSELGNHREALDKPKKQKVVKLPTPTKALTLKKIENELGVSFLPETATHKHRMEIYSETSDNIYVVAQTKLNNIWQCACFGFRRHRHCKHLKAIVPVIESSAIFKEIENEPTKTKKKATQKRLGTGSVQKKPRQTGKSKAVGKSRTVASRKKGKSKRQA